MFFTARQQQDIAGFERNHVGITAFNSAAPARDDVEISQAVACSLMRRPPWSAKPAEIFQHRPDPEQLGSDPDGLSGSESTVGLGCCKSGQALAADLGPPPPPPPPPAPIGKGKAPYGGKAPWGKGKAPPPVVTKG
jgi:hypothetical protein